MKLLFTLFSIAAFSGNTQGAIVHSGTQNILIPTTFVGVYIDIDGGDAVAEEGAGWDVNFIFNGEGIGNSQAFQTVATNIALDAPCLNLAFGQLVNGSSIFSTAYPSGYSNSANHVGTDLGQFATSTEGYIGFKFTTNSSAGPYYGWMRVELSNTAATGLVKDWAFENNGTAINVGAVPEPSVILSLFIGGSALCYRRRR